MFDSDSELCFPWCKPTHQCPALILKISKCSTIFEKIFLLPPFAANHPPITFTIATLLNYNKEMKHITIKITLIPSFKNVHTKKPSVAELPQKKKRFENHSDFFRCKPSPGSYANHHPTSAIMRLHLLKLLDLSIVLLHGNMWTILFSKVKYINFWLAAKYRPTLYNNFTF